MTNQPVKKPKKIRVLRHSIFASLVLCAIPLLTIPWLLKHLLTSSSAFPTAARLPSATLSSPATDASKAAQQWYQQLTSPSPDARPPVSQSQPRQQVTQPKAPVGQIHPGSNSPAQTSRSRPPVAQATPSKQSSKPVLMAIAVAQDASNLALATSTSGYLLDNNGQVLMTLAAGQPIEAQPSVQGIDLNGWQAPASVWLMPKPGGYVWVGEHWYRGRVRLILQNEGLLAVNHVNLEEYLYSVVGSEMPSYWPVEALKAQAIAARSYALAQYVRPASAYYQMGNDERWQVYKGLDGEASSTQAAVHQTQSQVLSYRGGVVVSLYASTDEIVRDAHEGLGMSQEGARRLADQGYDHLHILGAYYPGVSLARLNLH
jgi:peptidoglycan hydrolase-like amidase